MLRPRNSVDELLERQVQHFLHVPALFIGLAEPRIVGRLRFGCEDLCLRSTVTLRQSLDFFSDMGFGMTYSPGAHL